MSNKASVVTKEKPVLLVVEGPLRGQQWVMHESEMLIGRGAECHLVISDRAVSREHVRIWRDGNQYFVEDIGSKNGTHVNGVLLGGSQELKDGDEIQVALAVKVKFIGSEATVPLSLDSPPARSIGGLKLDANTHDVWVNGKRLDPPLSLYQYRLLALLYERSGGICGRDEVVRIVWPEADEQGVSEQAIDALVRRLRDRLTELDPDNQLIATVRGHGFRMMQPEAMSAAQEA